MQTTVKLRGKDFAIQYSAAASLKSFDAPPDIWIEEVICCETGCETTLTNEEESLILPDIQEHFRENYDPTPTE